MRSAPNDCGCNHADDSPLNRREFVQTVGATAAVAGLGQSVVAGERKNAKPTAETLVTKLYESFTPEQKKTVCFDWDHQDERGLLRTHVSNNWNITKQTVGSKFFTADQQDIIEALFWSMYNPEWHARIRKQLQDDAGGYGKRQSIAVFGEPGTGKFEFVMTGRHLTIRCDGDSTDHFAFGGPIFYGHAAQGFNEKPDHPGNVFWHQALQANKLYEMLDGKQRKEALVRNAPPEEEVQFRGARGEYDGIPVAELSPDQHEQIERVLQSLVEPYRSSDRQEALACLKSQGGLSACSIAFYELDDVGKDKVWDTWRIEGPSFVWHFRGDPHVHVWVNVADNAAPRISTAG